VSFQVFLHLSSHPITCKGKARLPLEHLRQPTQVDSSCKILQVCNNSPSYLVVDFDTGSSDLFLPGANCNTNCAGHAIYYPGSSSTSTAIGAAFTLTYGDGSSVVGTTYTDNVAVAGITATHQTVCLVSVFICSNDLKIVLHTSLV
jgi:Eukaryotic aspartyl protease